MQKIYSFDVFDTCLTRKVATPIDVFRLMAPDVACVAGVTCSESWVEEFTRARVCAEQVSRKGKPDSETDIYSIWNEVRNIINLPDYAYEDIELKWEEYLCIPVPKIQTMVSQARSENIQILFVSDMYLPSQFIKKLLEKNGFFQESDRLYVSSEIGATKSSGLIYQYIQKDLGISLECITHHGDNFYSDVQKAIFAGCKADHFPDTELNRYEEGIRSTIDISPVISTQIAGAMRASRMTNGENPNLLATHFVTPFLFAFVSWVLKQAETDGVKRLYFLGRDCQLAHKFACHPLLAKSGVDCRYLQASRRAYMLASVTEISPKGLPWIDREYDEKEIARILDKLELLPEEFDAAWRKITNGLPVPKILNESKDWVFFWETIKSESLSSKILNNALQKRKVLQKYLIQEGIFDEAPAAFVDLGWTFSIQRAAELVMQELNPEFRLGGYYLGASFEKFNDVSAKYLFFPCPPMDKGSELSCLFFPERATILEQIIGKCTHSTLQGFNSSAEVVQPILAQATSSDKSKDVERFHRNALDALEFYPHIICQTISNKEYRKVIRQIILQTFERPCEDLASGAAGIDGAPNAYSMDEKPCVLPYRWVDLFKAILGKNKSKPSRLWVEGSLAITPRSIRGFARRLGFINNLSTY